MNKTCPTCGAPLAFEVTGLEETVLTPRCGLRRRSRPARVAFCPGCDYAAEATTEKEKAND
jgi:uncharacterized Zn finger protein (UPF0148 family)